MTDEQNQPNTDESSAEDQKPDELSMLKSRARMMGITFSNNISVETLKQKIQEKIDGDEKENVEVDELNPPETIPPVEALVNPSVPAPTKANKSQTLRQQVTLENMRLIRVRITNMDPKKKNLPGEVVTVANEYLGTVRKFVPFGEVTEDGYHIPYCIYKQLLSRKFLNIRTYKDRKNNNQIKVEQHWAKEFSIEVLPPLTKEELNHLAVAQTAAGGLS